MKKVKQIVIASLIAPLVLSAAEITVQNDSLTNNGTGAIQAGFVVGEEAAVWLDSPCDGNIVAAQILWRSQSGVTPTVIQDSIKFYDAGTFPNPGSMLDEIVGPVLTDGVINEYRFKDENSVIPLIVPVTNGNTYVMSLKFLEQPPATGPSVVNDTDGCQAGRNGINALLPPLTWFSSCDLGVSGDWVMRAVIDCTAPPNTLDLSVQTTPDSTTYTPNSNLTFSVTVSNAGPTPANAATLIDFFPSSLNNITWSCTGTDATCPNTSGSGNITESINLIANSSLTYAITATVAANATQDITNTAQIVVPNGLTDTDTNNNSAATTWTLASNDLIFANGFE
ncbi:MAG TPA: DUF11 domain-containing protein [Oceanospirillales bacterium]|nr:DUF11 domain-containing protein [Oceanospirillales bacterium]